MVCCYWLVEKSAVRPFAVSFMNEVAGFQLEGCQGSLPLQCRLEHASWLGSPTQGTPLPSGERFCYYGGLGA